MLKFSFVDVTDCFTFVVVIVQSPSHIWPSCIFATPRTAEHQDSVSFTVSWSLFKLMSIESSNHLILCCPLLLLPSRYPASGSFPMNPLFPSGGQTIGTSGLTTASVLPMNIQGWFPLGLTGFIPSVQVTLKSPLQRHSLKTSILWHSAFFLVQLSHSYLTTEKTIALTIYGPLSTKWCICFLILCLGFS